MDLLAYVIVTALASWFLIQAAVSSSMPSRSVTSLSALRNENNGVVKASLETSKTTLGTTSKTNKSNVYLLVLLPEDQTRMFSIDRAKPAIRLAVESDKVAEILPNHNLVTLYEDSQCHIAAAINQAIRHYIKGTVDAFIGPVCDYSIAPVARQAKYWNLPVITSGAMARDFQKVRDELYSTLTRVGPNYNTLIAFVGHIFKHYNYTRVNLVFEPDGQNNVLDLLCHVMTDGMHNVFKAPDMGYNISNEYSKLEENSQIEYILREKVGVKYGGEYLSVKFGRTRSVSQPLRSTEPRSRQSETIMGTVCRTGHACK